LAEQMDEIATAVNRNDVDRLLTVPRGTLRAAWSVDRPGAASRHRRGIGLKADVLGPDLVRDPIELGKKGW
jgi:hypothetical protein